MKYQTIDQFRELYNEWKSSHLCVRSFCRNMGINESRFYYWKKKIESPSARSSGSFIPIEMNQRNGKIQMCSGQDGKPLDSSPTSAQEVCEIVYGNGVILRIKSNMSLEMLKALITL